MIKWFVGVCECLNLQRGGTTLEHGGNSTMTVDGEGDKRKGNLVEEGEAASRREEEATSVQS